MKNFNEDNSGATQIEYALITVLVIITCLVAMKNTGTSIYCMFMFIKAVIAGGGVGCVTAV